MNNSENPILAQ